MTLWSLPDDFQIRKVAIVDDDRREAEVAELEAEDAGFEPFIVEGGPFRRIEDLTNLISSNAQAAICDHRLRHSGFANFTGARLVPTFRSLWREKIELRIDRTKQTKNALMERLQPKALCLPT